MERVGRMGYFNVPAKPAELTRDMLDSPVSDRYNGFCHHRWLIGEEGAAVVFHQKGALETTTHWFNDNIFELLEKYPELCVFEKWWRDGFIYREAPPPLSPEEMFNRTQDYIQALETKYFEMEEK